MDLGQATSTGSDAQAAAGIAEPRPSSAQAHNSKQAAAAAAYQSDDSAASSVPFSGCAVSPRIRSYLLEWLLTLIVIVVPLAIAYVFIPFRNKTISLLDASIQQPYYHADSLPILSVFIPTVVVPLVCFVAYPFALSRGAGRMGLPPHPFSWHYTYWWSSCLVQTVGLTVLLSELMKRLIQAPRPDFLWRCFPNGIPADVQAKAAANNYLINTDQCQVQDNSIFEDGLQSLPSEHTSLAFCMTTVLILFFWTLRRELIAHATRLGRQGRAAQRDALIARLVASGVPPRRARKLATGVSSAGSDSAEFNNHCKRIDTCASPELRPPTLIEPDLTPSPEKILAQVDPTRAKHGDSLSVPRAGAAQLHPHVAAAVAAAASSTSAASSAPIPTEAQVPNENPSRSSNSPRPEVALGGSVLTAKQAPSPAVVSFWPHSHVVYIAHILFPVGWAISVGLSRTFDHKHSFSDVLVGGVLGVVVALAVYRMHLVKFEGYHQRWNGHEGREQLEMDHQAAERQRRSQATQRLLGQVEEEDEENQLQQHARHTPTMQFDGAALGPVVAPRDEAPFTVQLHQPRPRSNSQAHVLAPQESMESSMELPTVHPTQATQASMQLPSRTHSREQEPDPALGRTSFSNGLGDLSHAHDADQMHEADKQHRLPGHVEELPRALNNV